MRKPTVPAPRSMTALLRILCLAAICGGAADADIIYSDFGPGDSYSSIDYSIASGGPTTLGTDFVAAQSAALDTVTGVWSSGFSGSFIATWTVSLLADASGQPGAVLETWPVDLTSVPTPVTLASTRHPELEAGMEYWLLLTTFPTANGCWCGGVFTRWAHNDEGVTGGEWVYWPPEGPGGSFVDFYSSESAPVIEVTGTPEPGTWVLLAGELGFLALVLAKTSKQNWRVSRRFALRR